MIWTDFRTAWHSSKTVLPLVWSFTVIQVRILKREGICAGDCCFPHQHVSFVHVHPQNEKPHKCVFSLYLPYHLVSDIGWSLSWSELMYLLSAKTLPASLEHLMLRSSFAKISVAKHPISLTSRCRFALRSQHSSCSCGLSTPQPCYSMKPSECLSASNVQAGSCTSQMRVKSSEKIATQRCWFSPHVFGVKCWCKTFARTTDLVIAALFS